MAGANDGHRKRLKTRFEKYGLNNFSDVEAIELLLFYVRARCDTKVIAQRLLKRFETLGQDAGRTLGGAGIRGGRG